MRSKLAMGTALTLSMVVALPAMAQQAADNRQIVGVGEAVVGALDAANGFQWYSVQLDAGQTYTIDVEGQATGQGSLGDPLLILQDSNGAELAQNDDGGVGLNSSLPFTPDATGEYIIGVTSFGGSTGDFLVSVSSDTAVATTATDQADDFHASTGTTGRLALGSSATGELETAGDADWFAIDLQAHQLVILDLEGAPSGGGTLSDPLMVVYDQNGAEVARNDDGGDGLNSRLEFNAPTAGTYYVQAGAFGGATGTYTVSAADGGIALTERVAEASADDFGATVATAGFMTVNSSAYGELEQSGDTDWFSVNLGAGSQVTIDLEGEPTGAGTLSDPLVMVYDQNGNELARDDDGGESFNSRLNFSVPAAGTYYIEARAFGGATGTYVLTVTEVGSSAVAAVEGPAVGTDTPADDFTADTGTSGQIASQGVVTGELEVNGDRDWFAITLGAGQTVILDLEGDATEAGSLQDPYMAVFDQAGNQVTRDDDGGEGYNSRLEFTAPNAGTYFVEARGFAGATGTYRLTASDSFATDDYAGDVSTAGGLGVGGSIAGDLEVNNDTDWFAISLTEGQVVTLDLEGSPTNQGTLPDPYLTIYDSNGNQLLTNDDGGQGLNSSTEFTAPYGGTFFVEARGFGGDAGTYLLSAQSAAAPPPPPPPPSDDYADNVGTSGEIGVGGTVLGDLEQSNDKDWFAIQLVAGETVVFDLQGAPTNQGTLTDPYLTIFDQAGNELQRNDDGGEGVNSQLEFTAPTTGIYYLEARGFGGASGTYILSAAQVAGPPLTIADDYASDVGTTASLQVGGQSYGELESPNDADWFALVLGAGQTVELSLEGEATGAGTLSDPLMVVYDQFGNQLDRNDDGGEGLNSNLQFTAPGAGTYYVSAEAFGSSTGSYSLSAYPVGPPPTVGKGPGDDYPSDASTTGTLAVNGSASGNIEQIDDTDWFAIQLGGGETVQISLEGAPTGAGTLPDPVLAVFDQNGYEVAYNDDGGDSFNSLVTFVAPATGTYYVSAEAFADHTGTYLLSAAPGVVDDYPNDFSTPAVVAIGRPAGGTIENPGDTDWFAVNLTAGQPVTIRLEGSATGGGTLSDPFLELYDGNGNFIDSDDDDGETLNSMLVYTPRVSGQHYLAAGGFSSNTGTYTLSVEAGAPIRDDYPADATTSGQAQVNSTVYGELESPGDEDWFFVNLQPGNYIIDLEGQGTGMGSLSDPYLLVYNANGLLIDQNDDGGQGLNSQLRLGVGAPSSYFIGAGAFGDGTGSYALTVTSGGK
ncbi:MAG: PPC domain-containing protein [Pseudomonadota bacterium]